MQTVFGQIKSFSYDPTTFYKELSTFLKANNNEAGQIAWDAFSTQLNKGNISAEQTDKLIDLCNSMLDKKMRPSPAFSEMLNAVTSFLNSGQTYDQYDNWMTASAEIIKTGTTSQFVNFMKFSGPFYSESALYFSQSKVWRHDAYEFQMKVENGQPEIFFPALNIIGQTTGDRTFIFNTTGTYFPLDNIFIGSGGRVNWMKAQLDSNNVYGTLGEFTINLEKAELRIDSITFNYIGYLNKPLQGTYVDKLIVNPDPGKFDYPQFKSYDNQIKIENVIDKVDYYGNFFLKGNKVIGASEDSSYARLEFRDNLDRKVMTARSKSFLIKPDDIFSQHASVTLHVGQDSIYHPDVNLNYKANNQTVTLSRGEIGAAGAAYYSSFHRIDIDIDQLVWALNDTTLVMRNLSGGGEKRSYFESQDLFSQDLYQSVQAVSPANPLVLIKRFSEKSGTRILTASSIAKEINPSLTVDGIRSLLYDMMKSGFIFYDPNTNMVTVKDKLVNYVDSYIGKRDYDIIQMMSQTKGNNAELDLKKYDLHINGVDQVYLSDSQFVLIYPIEGKLLMKKDRDMNYDGRTVGGNADFVGTGFYFDYDTFNIKMTMIDSMILYVESTETDKYGNVLYLPVKTNFSNLSGELQIDRADNKSSRKNFPEYPIFQSYSTSKADYEKPEVFNGVYKKDEFFFKADPFHVEQMDEIDYRKIEFGGTMISDGIFPDFRESLSLQEDRSLGFKTKTPPEGYAMYGGLGKYNDSIYLSNEGFKGSGLIEFMASKSRSSKINFFPDSTIAAVENFDITKTTAGTEFPAVDNTTVDLLWMPYKDQMFIHQGETPFNFFDSLTTLTGSLTVTSGGLLAEGTMKWLDAELYSNLFGFGAETMFADTASMIIKSIDPNKLALRMNDVSAFVDFGEMTGHFISNIDTVMTEMPFNQYKTTINEFDWDMTAGILDFKSTNKEFGNFYSTNPEQDGLWFEGTNGKFNLKTYILGVEGVPHIAIADAHVIPDSGKVFIESDAKMRTLQNATIVADTIYAYHNIKKANVDIYGRNAIAGKGVYEYTTPQGKLQEIPIEEITVKKLKDSLTNVYVFQLFAKGYVQDTSKFELERKVLFKGPVEVNTTEEFLRFKGYVKLEVSDTANFKTDWFRVDQIIDPAEPTFNMNIAKSESNDSVYAGVFKRFDSPVLYTSLMGKRYSKSDQMIYVARGDGYYDENESKFFFGNVEKTFDNTLPGSLMIYDDKTGDVTAEGPLYFGMKTEIVDIKSYGSIAKKAIDSVYSINSTLAFNLPIDEEVMKAIGELIYNGNVESDFIDYFSSPLLLGAIYELGDEKQSEKLMESVNQIGYLSKPKDIPYSLLITGIPLTWDEGSKAIRSTGSTGQIVWIGPQQINQNIKTYVEFSRKSGIDNFTLYFETPYEDYFYITYRKGQMKLYTSSDAINEKIFTLPDSKRTIEADGKRLVYMLESKPAVGKFVRRMMLLTGESTGELEEDTDE
ncbi:MAG: hypothetical protein KBF51_00710 [Chitinophagales bacterium]|nr:hypothetical protein [Chitinophagales bacterium]MBP9188025.1 hypothetical protein [Chitinophagales bacterium]MBP9547656.1 hypothetical protein [Chitinophagales bacterium]